MAGTRTEDTLPALSPAIARLTALLLVAAGGQGLTARFSPVAERRCGEAESTIQNSIASV
jgi:hypothetical protein